MPTKATGAEGREVEAMGREDVARGAAAAFFDFGVVAPAVLPLFASLRLLRSRCAFLRGEDSCGTSTTSEECCYGVRVPKLITASGRLLGNKLPMIDGPSSSSHARTMTCP